MGAQQDSLQEWFSLPKQGHVVASYPSEGALAKSLALYIKEGVAAGDNCLVITNLGITKHLRKALKAAHVESSSYTILNANAVLEDFMVNGLPDKKLFFQRINGILDRNFLAGGRLRLYGDMVAQLWMEGNKAAAIALEKLWDDFAQTQAFSLYCAYPEHLFHGNADEWSRVGDQHDLSVSLAVVEARL